MALSVFFTNVPYTTTAGYLRKIFSSIGRVEDLALYLDYHGYSIGAGVVYFASASVAERAVRELNNVDVDGRLMLVKVNEREKRRRPDSTVFFNGVPYNTTEGYIRAKFERSGRIVDFDLWRRADGLSQGMGTCEFSTAPEARRCIGDLNGALVDGRRLLVQMDCRPDTDRVEAGEAATDPPGEPWQHRAGRAGKADGKGRPQCRVFWSNADPATTEGYLRSHFEQVGTIVDFDYWRRPDGSSLGMGLCEYDHHLGAWRALERLCGREIDGRRLLLKSDDGGRDGVPRPASGKKGSKGTGKGKQR
mmetsp:Transcript_44704/g.133545  ORF Transcript_44704/g.133545 Transcript_44704/m.133545 type:complete len:305 (-) Transcript_44704:50-964(-)|eukprot:CAMPEP_0175221894 /NCGR_PEP_ID=MMETSP0093-20121207/20537_1 /TAXON_ID=311494 /ORGANISM="Alexandrium monilatum, Strain CCMP3105" /LENGTH=304 /DNA_ID=CAMNT_0016515451 /DNA_START=103 /DNA_END=1017 /DNA_ORIENTATION=-